MSQTEKLSVAVVLSLSRYKQAMQSRRFSASTRHVTIIDAEQLCEGLEQWRKQAQHLLARVIDSENLAVPIDRSDELRQAYKFVKTLMLQIDTLREGIRDYHAGKAKLLTTVMDELRKARSSNGQDTGPSTRQ